MICIESKICIPFIHLLLNNLIIFAIIRVKCFRYYVIQKNLHKGERMDKYSMSDITRKSELDKNTIMQIIESYSLPILREGDRYIFDAVSCLLICKIAKILKQDITQTSKEQKILKLIHSNNNITISDVATIAGVSIGAVSRVLNNKEDTIKISEKTRNRIIEVADILGYRANPFASALRTKKTGIIGAVIRDIEDPFLRQLVREVQQVCNSFGLDILMSHAKHEAATAEKQVYLMMNQLFDGLLIFGDMTGDDNLMRNLSEYNLPVVSLGGHDNDYISTIGYDDVYGAKTVIDYLYKLGHQHIAFIGNTKHMSVQKRLSVFQELAHKYQLTGSKELVFTASSALEAMNHTKYILTLPNPPSAIFCSSDLLAQGAMSAVFQMGKKIPQDMSIIGYDDVEALSEIYVPLTTMKQPILSAAEKAVTELISQIEAFNTNNKKKPINIKIKPELVIRKSCLALNK